MKCQKCQKNEATTHIKRVINGEFEEYNLCSDCAKEMGYGNLFHGFTSSFADDFNSLFGSFFENALPARTQATRCETCGSSYNDIQRTGMMGCADCYSLFAGEIMPTIRKIHGNTTHCGKNSAAFKAETAKRAVEKADDTKPESELDKLRAELNEAVEKQEFEKAAELRDKIKSMEGKDE
ncbi:MAG: UvrB/UvrC motif-containing protein [Ruminococcus sp.]|nr:UvrB/UvrC motif-containing protein [Ruminococcus sp.]